MPAVSLHEKEAAPPKDGVAHGADWGQSIVPTEPAPDISVPGQSSGIKSNADDHYDFAKTCTDDQLFAKHLQLRSVAHVQVGRHDVELTGPYI